MRVTTDIFRPEVKIYNVSLGSLSSIKYDKKGRASKDFFKVMGNWNLDTEYKVRIYIVDRAIHDRYEYSCAK